MELSALASEAKLDYDETNSLTIGNYRFSFIKADIKVRNIKNPWISRYYLVDLEESNIELLKSIEGFYLFQKTLLSDTYFDIKNDIRWNIYLVFLIKNSYREVEAVSTWDIENDENYARKYFFTYSDCLDFFRKENFLTDPSSVNIPSSPVNDWFEILEQVHLTGVLTGKYLKNNVNDYLDGSSFLTTEMKTESEKSIIETSKIPAPDDRDKRYLVENISKVSLGNFRKHCFGENRFFSPALVNLVHGSNGCGKTSILEAIEFALTGEIKRLKDFNEKFRSLPMVSAKVETKAGNIVYTSNESFTISKELDRVWYGTPSGREKSTLNNNFNHFNSFNSETAFKFALEESQNQNDYSEKFSRLIYDDDILSMEKLWRKYREYFEEELDKRKGIFKSISNESLQIQKEIIELKQKSSALSFDDLLDLIKFRSKMPISGEGAFVRYESIYASIQTIKPLISNFHSRWSEIGLACIDQLRQELKQTHTDLNSQGENFTDKISKIKNLEGEKIHCLKQISSQQALQAESEAEFIEVVNSLSKWHSFKKILCNSAKVVEYQSLLTNVKSVANRKDFLTLIISKYPDVLAFKEIDVSILNDMEIKDITEKLTLNKLVSKDLDEQLKVISGSINKIKQLKIQIHDIGAELINLNEQKDMCPLCGKQHQDNEKLIEAITKNEGSVTKEERFIVELEKKRGGIVKEFDTLNLCLQDNSQKQNNLDLVVKVTKEINNSEYYTLNLNGSAIYLLFQLKQTFSNIDSLTRDYNRLMGSIKSYEVEGFSNDSIATANIFKEQDKYYKAFLVNGNETDLFEQYIVEIRQQLISIIQKYSFDIAALERQVKTIDLNISTQGIDDVRQKITFLKKRLEQLKQLDNDYTSLKSYFYLNDSDLIIDWLNTVEITLLNIDVVIVQVRAVQNLDEKQDKFKQVTLRIEELKRQISRGNIALGKFNLLKSLNEYSIQFIKNNIERIGYFFKALHTPREFRTLDVNSGGVFALRQKDNEEVRMHQMSTGQRISLALAIMFSLYIAAPRAPKILILDEPVANMDDLHLLNLIDILREFALRRTQIIVTTANPDVAGIFRRKFSFFGPEFRHYELVRKNDDCTEMITLEYTPDCEEPKILSIVS